MDDTEGNNKTRTGQAEEENELLDMDELINNYFGEEHKDEHKKVLNQEENDEKKRNLSQHSSIDREEMVNLREEFGRKVEEAWKRNQSSGEFLVGLEAQRKIVLEQKKKIEENKKMST